MANKELFGGVIAASSVSPPTTITVIPSYATNKTLAQIFFNTNTGISGITCTHSVDGALTPLVPLTTGYGQYAAFEIDNATSGEISFNWIGGGIARYSDVIVIEGSQTVATNATATGSGTSSVSVLSAGTATDHYAFCGQRYAAATPVPDALDAELHSAFGESIGVSTIYEPWTDGDAADWAITGGNVWTAVSYLITSATVDSIDTINGGAAVTDGQTGVPFTYTGFAAAITSILLDTAGNSVPALNVVDNRDGTGSFDMPSIAGIISDAGTDVVNFGVISTLFAGIQSASKALTVAVAAGYEEVVLAGLETTDTNYLYQVMLEDRTLENGESVYYATSTGTIAADGQISMVGDSMNIIVITADRVAKPYTLLIASSGSGTTKTFDISIGISI